MSTTYQVINGPMPTTAAPVKVATGTAIKTMLQILPLQPLVIVEWGWSGDALAAATPGEVELITTGSIAATVTAYANADVMPYHDPFAPVNVSGGIGPLTVGVAASGYTASAEGTIVATRELDLQQIAGFNGFSHPFPLGREPGVKAGEVLRIRNTFAATVNAYCYIIFEA